MTENTRILNRFEYYVEDLDCRYCLYYKGKRKTQQHGCWEDSCRFADIRQEAIDNGRIKRKPGWFKIPSLIVV